MLGSVIIFRQIEKITAKLIELGLSAQRIAFIRRATQVGSKR